MEKLNSFEKGNIKLKKYLELKSLYENDKYNKFETLANEYLDEYPNEVYVRFMRAKVLRSYGKFDSAIHDLKYILSIEDNNQYALAELFYAYYFLGKYDNALKLLSKMYQEKILKGDSLAIAELVMKNHLGMDYNNQKNKRCEYIRNQIKNYDKRKLYEVLDQHQDMEKFYEGNEGFSIFNENVDTRYLLVSVEENLKNAQKENTYEIMDIYYFAVPNIGVNYGNTANYIKVVVVPKTKNIISIYPVFNVKSEIVPTLICDYNRLFKREQKQKTISRIEKFNKKYGK